MRKVLWLASWYPNAADPFTGDFIKRQAAAVSIFQPLKIIYVGKYNPEILPHESNPSISENSLDENILYYSSATSFRKPFSKIRSLISWFRKNLEVLRELQKKNELPDLVHVQVAMKAGLVALYLKWKYKIPYILTEHWSGYYEQAADSLFRKSFLDKYLTRRVLKNAAQLLPVSEALGNQISYYWAQVPFQKIPNVVDTRFFYPGGNKPASPFRFIHVSSLLYPKNPEGIIRTFKLLLQSGYDAELILVGPMNPSLSSLIQADILLTGKIRITGEVSYEQVGRELRESQVLVMFSFYENMPCVMLEALCTGIPVIASRVGGIPEAIDAENGILVEAGNESELFEAMKSMIEHIHDFNQDSISRQAVENYSYEAVGREIARIYDSVLDEVNYR